MLRIARLAAGVALAAALAASTAVAADSYYMNVPGVPGDSTAQAFEDWIDVGSFSLGFANGVCSSLTVQKRLDVASPKLTLAAMTGQVFNPIELVSLTAADQPFVPFRLKLFTAVITTVSQSGQSGFGPPAESISIQPLQVELTYYTQGATGGVSTPTSVTIDCQRTKTK